MQNKNPELGPLGAKFFAYAQTRHLNIARLGEIQRALNLSAVQERRLLERLNKDGFIFRLQRGIYIIPNKITAGGFWRPNEYLIIAIFMELHNAHYYVGGLNAFNRHGLSTQIANQFTVYNDKVSILKKFGTFKVRFIKVDTNRINGFDNFPIPGNQKEIHLSNLQRTILDAINDWNRYQTLPTAYEWLRKQSSESSFLKKFILLTAQTANNNTIRRVGFYLEKIGINSKLLSPLLKKIKPTKGWVNLIPNKNRRGITNKKWGVIHNVE